MNTLNTKNFIKSTLIALALVFGTVSASAAFINGDITMSGDFAPTGGSGADLSDATGIDFLGDDFGVDDATGDFAAAGITTGDVGFFQDFQFNPLNPAPVNPLWSIGGFDFALEAISIVFQNADFIVLEGNGTISGNGFDDTAGLWNLTANQNGTIFNFSSGATATGQVPEPGSLALLGAGLIGFGLVRRFKK